jgi:RimJ/RimL family protein N-acetyltransferase
MPTVTRATPSDLDFILQTERLPGYDAVVGRWPREKHEVAMADGRHAYFILPDGEAPAGFAIVRDWGSPERVASIKRIAVARPGSGRGRVLLRAVVDAVFTQTDAHRLWLGVFPDNARARRAYEAVGFVPEGIARGSAWFGGVHRDELVMAILRPEWEPRAG